MNDLQWVEFRNNTGKRLPRCHCTFGLAPDGEVFASAALAGNKNLVCMCAAMDGVTIFPDKHTFYVPLSWLAREFKHMEPVRAKFEPMVRKHFAEEGVA